jgi:hypothetical protein
MLLAGWRLPRLLSTYSPQNVQINTYENIHSHIKLFVIIIIILRCISVS